MNRTEESACSRELAFFRKIGADVSHEMRNSLSIIAEYAGLAEDLLAADENGRCRDPVRAKELAALITERVRTGTESMERFSRVVHAVDEPESSFDIGSLAENVAALSRRRAILTDCRLEVAPRGEIPVRANPLSLQCAMLSAIEIMLEYQEEGTVARIEISSHDSVAEIAISGPAPDGDKLSERIGEVSAIMDTLRGTAVASWNKGTLSVILGVPTH